MTYPSRHAGTSHCASRLARLVRLHIDLQDEMAVAVERPRSNRLFLTPGYPLSRLDCLTWHSTPFTPQDTLQTRYTEPVCVSVVRVLVLPIMFETQSLGEPSSPRRFHLVSNEVQEGVVTPQQPPAEMESTSTEPHVEIFQPDETFSSSPVSTQPDDFLQAQEVIQAGDDGHAREAIQIRYSREFHPVFLSFAQA